jgi:hypothetical protein
MDTELLPHEHECVLERSIGQIAVTRSHAHPHLPHHDFDGPFCVRLDLTTHDRHQLVVVGLTIVERHVLQHV